MPTLPLTQLDERGPAAELDNRTFSLTFAQPVAVRDVLLLLVRGTSLSVIPAPDVSGMFIGDLKNVTVRQALSLILPPLGLDYNVDTGFIRVFKREPETRLFDINYIATERTGTSTLGVANTAAVSTHDEGRTLRRSDEGRADVCCPNTRRSTWIEKRGCCRSPIFPSGSTASATISTPCTTASTGRWSSRRASWKSS